MSETDMKREAMKHALAHKLKVDMAETARAKNAMSSHAAALQYMSLNDQLREVEEMRRKNKMKEAEMYAKMREQMEKRARNVAASAAASADFF